MSSLALTMLAVAAVWMLGFVWFLYALRARWLARFEQGFFFSLLIGISGMALMSSSLVGTWGYLVARQSVGEELLVGLNSVADIVEGNVTDDVEHAQSHLVRFATAIAPTLVDLDARDLQTRLEGARDVNPRYLQMRIFDDDGRVLAALLGEQGEEPSNRIAVAYALTGEAFVSEAFRSEVYGSQSIYLSAPIRAADGEAVLGVVTALYDIQDALTDLVEHARFNQSGYAVVVDGDGQIVAHPDPARLEEDVLSYPAVQMARNTRGSGSVVAPNAAGIERLFVYRAIANPSTTGRDPWVLLTEIDQSEQLAVFYRLARELFLGIGLLVIVSLVVARQISVSIKKPLYELRDFARRVGSGDLTGHTSIQGQDVAGSLAAALNDMVRALLERDRVKEVFGRYIATQVSEKILSGQVNLGGESRKVSMLLSDIRNFTGMSEQMSPQQVVSFLNDYFSEMVDAVFDNGGILDKFMGDGLLAVFGSLGDQPDHARRAVLAALKMKALLAKINGVRAVDGKPPIHIGIGVHTDEVVVGNIGSRKRLEYTVVGDGVNTTSRLQTLNKEFGTTILISEATYQEVKDMVVCREMPASELRGKAGSVRLYEVVSLKAEGPQAAA